MMIGHQAWNVLQASISFSETGVQSRDRFPLNQSNMSLDGTHPGLWQFVMRDTSVQMLSTSAHTAVLGHLANRHDGRIISGDVLQQQGLRLINLCFVCHRVSLIVLGSCVSLTGYGPGHSLTYPVDSRVVFADDTPLTTGGIILFESTFNTRAVI